jgi:hypothetical protein
MRRISLIIIIAITLPVLSQAQEPAVNVGDNFFNFGIGFGHTRFSGSGYSGTIPPLSVSFEKIIKDEILEKGYIGIGGYVGYSSYKWNYTFLGDDWGWRYSTFLPGARGSFHYPILDNLDTYTGMMLGYEIISAREIGNVNTGLYNASTSGFVWSWYAGGRYFVSEKFILMAEIGYGVTYLNLGVALKY